MKVMLIELLDFEGWILRLGADREWKVQYVQHHLYSVLQKRVSAEGGFLIPLTFHNMLIIANGVKHEGFSRIFNYMKKVSPVAFRASEGAGKTFKEAIEKAAINIAKLKEGEVYFGDYEESELAVAHFDLNSYLSNFRNGRIFDALKQINGLISLTNRVADKVEGVSVYLGGDNAAVFAGKELIEELGAIKLNSVKVGVGIAYSAREGLKLAAEALSHIRRHRDQNVKILSHVHP